MSFLLSSVTASVVRGGGGKPTFHDKDGNVLWDWSSCKRPWCLPLLCCCCFCCSSGNTSRRTPWLCKARISGKEMGTGDDFCNKVPSIKTCPVALHKNCNKGSMRRSDCIKGCCCCCCNCDDGGGFVGALRGDDDDPRGRFVGRRRVGAEMAASALPTAFTVAVAGLLLLAHGSFSWCTTLAVSILPSLSLSVLPYTTNNNTQLP